MKKWSLAAAVIVAAVSCGGERREAPASQSPGTRSAAVPASANVTVGARMPPYSAPMLDGTTFDIEKERGNVVFLNLWATWCGPCRFEIPELEKLHAEHAGHRFKVVGVSVDEGGPQVVQDFVTEQKMTYPVVLDPQGRLADLFETSILPTSAIVDRTGRVVWKKIGIVTANDAEMLRAIEAALHSGAARG